MGVDISMVAGVGIHITSDQLDKWLLEADPEDEYGLDVLYETLPDGIEWTSPNNSWTDTENYPRGIVVYVSRVSTDYDMGRSAEAGIYRPGDKSITLAERQRLLNIAKNITGEELPIEPFIAVGIH